MHTHEEALGKDCPWNMLESQYPQLFLILALRIYDPYRFHPGGCPGRGLLEIANEAVDENWAVCFDEYDYVIGCGHDCEGILSSSLHGYCRSL